MENSYLVLVLHGTIFDTTDPQRAYLPYITAPLAIAGSSNDMLVIKKLFAKRGKLHSGLVEATKRAFNSLIKDLEEKDVPLECRHKEPGLFLDYHLTYFSDGTDNCYGTIDMTSREYPEYEIEWELFRKKWHDYLKKKFTL